MKLPSEPTQPVKTTGPRSPHPSQVNGASPSTSPEASIKLPRAIQTLINTWAKVESSQTLPPAQNQQVLSQLSAQIGQTPPNLRYSNGISEKLNLSTISQTLDKSSPLSGELKLVLVKLISVKGPLSILSERPFAKGSDVLITNTGDRLTLQQPKVDSLLQNFRHQYLSGHSTPKPISLIDNNQVLQSPQALKSTPNLSSSLPPSLLNTQLPITPNNVKMATELSGQNYEFNLNKLFDSITKNQSLPVNNARQNKADQSMTQKIVQVEQNIQKWVTQFKQGISQSSLQPPKGTESLNNQLNTSENIKSQTSTVSATSNAQNSISLSAIDKFIKSLPILSKNFDTQTLPTEQLRNIHGDQKQWLLQTQQALLNRLTQQLSQKGNSFIPNWSQTTHLGQPIKTFQDVSQWLTILLQPKTTPDNHTSVTWPKGLSVQNQIQQTLTALLNSLTSSEQDSSEQQLLRQLLSLNQSLMKVSHDQIQNRAWQLQSDMNQFQFSLPFVHQNQVQWCEMEYKQSQVESPETEKTQGWHLILRFAQESLDAFAIESHLNQEQLNITLWANNSEQLKKLHDNMPLIKLKLENAGFKIEVIQTKHGAPKPLNQPIQQTLIDVRT